jgi:hypothetical protein
VDRPGDLEPFRDHPQRGRGQWLPGAALANNALVTTNVDTIEPEAGTYQAAFLGLAGPQIAQTFTDTAGESLQVTVWYAVTDASADLEFMIGGVEHDVPIVDVGVYREFQFVFIAAGWDTLQVFSIAQAESVNMIDNLSIAPFVGVTETPEAATWTMMLAGFAGLGFAGLRRGRRLA